MSTIDLLVTDIPAEIALETFDIDPVRVRGKLVLDIASGFSNVTASLSDIGGAVSFGIDPRYADMQDMQEQHSSIQRPQRDARLLFGNALGHFTKHFIENPGSYIAADAASLPFRDDSVDIIFNNLFLASFEENEDMQDYTRECIKEWVRVLHDKGRAYIGVFPDARRVPADVHRQMSSNMGNIRACADELIKQRLMRKIAERIKPIGRYLLLEK